MNGLVVGIDASGTKTCVLALARGGEIAYGRIAQGQEERATVEPLREELARLAASLAWGTP